MIVLAVVGFSGLAVGTGAAMSAGQVSHVTTTMLPTHSPTFAGPANRALMGPFAGSAAVATPAETAQMSHSVAQSLAHVHLSAPAPAAPSRGGLSAHKIAQQTTPIPTVLCQPVSTGCDSVSTSSSATGVNGLNVVDSSGLFGLTIEPGDQGLCAGNGYVLESNNIGEMMVYNTGLQQTSADISLDSVMGLGNIPASMGGPWSSGGDISCVYDYDNGGHWIITEIVSNSSWAVFGPFGGCFAGKAFGCFEGIAVSVSNNPLGAYNVYYLNPNYNPSEPGYPFLLNDFAKIATTRDAFLVFYDEFPLNGSVPGLGGGFFNGAQEFAFDKKALELGFPVVEPTGGPDPYFTAVVVNMGLLSTPDGTCFSDNMFHRAGITCWYQVIPAHSPDPSQYDNANGGTGFMYGSLDFYGFGDTRIAIFDWTGLSNLNSYACSTCSSIMFGGAVFSGVGPYYELGFLAPQKAGPIPLGDACVAYGLNTNVTSCPESGIATNGDGFTQASLAGGQVWGAISTAVYEKFKSGTEAHIGVEYFVVGTSGFDTTGVFSMTNQGYVAAAHEDLEFPAIAGEGSSAQDGGNGAALLTFTLSGNGGPTGADHGGFYPSTAYGALTATSKGLLNKVIRIADLGKSPQDGFSEYQNLGGGATRPRWGDYSAAVFLPFSGGKVYFSTGFIQSPNCSDATFAVDPSCGGTRDPFANWGTSVNFAVP